MPTWWDTFTRGTPVEYRHVASGKWREAVTDSYRARDDAYMLVTQNGMTAAPVADVRIRES